MAFLVAINANNLLLLAAANRHEDENYLDDEIERDEEAQGVPQSIFLPGVLFNVRAISTSSCRRQFRFAPHEILEICELLLLPAIIKTSSRDNSPCDEALCLTLFRLSLPTKLDRMQFIFGRDPSAMSRIIRKTLRLIFQRWRHILRWDNNRLTREKLAGCANAIGAKGGHRSVFGFLDGTVRKICRPTFGQRSMYNGHKRFHALKYQSLITPDGIIIHLSGANAANVHDLTMYRRSNLPALLRQHAFRPNGTRLAIYGDPAYQL